MLTIDRFEIRGDNLNSSSHVTFHTTDGSRVLVGNGEAWMYDPWQHDSFGQPLGLPTPLCSTNMECARLKVEGVNIEDLHARAGSIAPAVYQRALQTSYELDDLSSDSAACADPRKLAEGVEDILKNVEQNGELNNLHTQATETLSIAPLCFSVQSESTTATASAVTVSFGLSTADGGWTWTDDRHFLSPPAPLPPPDEPIVCLGSPSGWSRPYGNVAISASGAESCKSQCAAGGYLFWGLECPMGNDVHCQCSSARWHTARRVVLRGQR